MKVVIIGAGFAGLGAGIELFDKNVEFKILEKSSRPGGLVKSDEIKGFLFDISGHYLHISNDLGLEKLIKNTVKFDNINRVSAVHVDGIILPYPIQYNLRFLKKEDVLQIVDELSDIRKTKTLKLKSLEDFFLKNFGQKLYSIFFKPYNEKLWGTDLKKLPWECLGGFFPKIDYEKIKKGSESDTNFKGYNGSFYYPKSGRIDSLTNNLANKIKSEINYNTEVVSIDVHNKCVFDKEGNVYNFDVLLSSAPLNQMQSFIKNEDIDLTLYSSNIVNTRVGFKGSLKHLYHWIYVPDNKYPFYRIGFPENANKNTCPSGFSSLSIESNQNNVQYSARELALLAIKFLKETDLISSEEILFSENKIIYPAYTSIPNHKQYNDYLQYLKNSDIHMIGRYGLWQYYSMEDAYISGHTKAEELSSQTLFKNN